MQSQERPVFRQDLVAEAVEDGGARYIDVADPDSGHMFRFFEVEYALACAMDGQRDVAGIIKWAQEELGVTPTAKEVQSVIATLADLRFVQGEAQAAAPAGKPDDELATGIVVGQAAKAAAKIDVELGQSGASPASAPPREAPMPKADFDLGAPGAAAAVARPPKAPVEDIALGAPGAAAKPAAAKPAPAPAPAPDLSMDLAAEMPVKAADVKEAVRASKVMTAVDVPKDLMDELEKPSKPAEKPAEKPVAAAPAPAPKPVEKPAEKPVAAAPKPAEKPAEKQPVATKSTEKPTEKQPVAAKKPAVELPKSAPEKTPVAPPAPAPKVSPVLVILLILVLVGGAAFAVWKFVLDKSDGPDASAQKQPPPKPPAPPPPPAEVTSKIAMETPPAQDIKVPAGAIETVEAADKDVKTGDVLATMVGAKALTTEIANVQKDVDKGATAIETAQKELADAQQKPNNQAGVTAAQTKLDKAKKPVDEKKATITKKQGDLDKLTIKATTDGKLTLAPETKAGAKTTADQVIGQVVRATVPTATFKIPAGTKVGADGNLSIVAGDKTVVCPVTDAQAETIKVTCPADSGLADGAAVKFTLPK